MKTPLKARPHDEPGLARGSRSGRFQPGPSSNARTRQNSTVPPSQRWTEGVPRRKVNSQHPSVSFLLEGGCNSKFCLLVLQRPPQGPTSQSRGCDGWLGWEHWVVHMWETWVVSLSSPNQLDCQSPICTPAWKTESRGLPARADSQNCTLFDCLFGICAGCYLFCCSKCMSGRLKDQKATKPQKRKK